MLKETRNKFFTKFQEGNLNWLPEIRYKITKSTKQNYRLQNLQYGNFIKSILH